MASTSRVFAAALGRASVLDVAAFARYGVSSQEPLEELRARFAGWRAQLLADGHSRASASRSGAVREEVVVVDHRAAV